MLKWLGKLVAERIVSMVVLLLTIGLIAMIWHYHNHLPSWQAVGRFIGGSALWLVLATLLPWATFFLVAWVERAESNLPAVGLLLFWAMLDGLLAWWVAWWFGGGRALIPMEWVGVALAFGLGGLYNLIAANQIANRLQRR